MTASSSSNSKSGGKPQAPASGQSASECGRFGIPAEAGVLIVFLAAVAYLAWQFPSFRTGSSGAVVLSRAADIGIVAAGMTLVIATGGIDISVGSVVGLCGIILGICTVKPDPMSGPGIALGWPLWAGVCAALGVGAGCGLVNGLLIARFRVPPIIATLAMFSAARAGAYALTLKSISGLPPALTDFGYGAWPVIPLPGGDSLAVPKAFSVTLISLIAAGLILKKSVFGRGLLAMGGSREATRLSGRPVRRTETWVYVISGLLAGLQAVMVTSKAAADPNSGQYFELSAITAVVLGGTSVLGGQATVLGTALGVMTMAVIFSGVQLSKQEPMIAMLVTAVVLLISVEVDRFRRRGFGLGRSSR